MFLSTISFAIAMTAILFATIALILAFIAWSTVVGLKNSTHKLQYVYVKDPELNEYSEKDLKPKIDDETGDPLPINGGEENTGLGLINQFKKNFLKDVEE